MKQQTAKVAITLTDGSLAVMDFLVVGRGSVLPFGAEWADRAAGWWMREANDANIEEEIGRSRQSGLGPVSSYRLISEAELPADRDFRDAWRDRGRIEVDMPAARELHRGRIRAARAARMAQLDGEWMRATGQARKDEADAVEAKRQVLRDLPADPAIEAASSPEQLKAFWPVELEV